MSTSLLDLSNEILQLIGRYVNQDLAIPLPSYGPHWIPRQNLIKPSTSRDISAYRATCRRIRDSCRLEGVHVVVMPSNGLTWDSEISEDMKKAVSRVSFAEGSYPNRFSKITPWLSFIDSMSQLPRLEEMEILGGRPCASHALGMGIYNPQSGDTIESLKRNLNKLQISKSVNGLTNLSSLNIATEQICQSCSIFLIQNLIPLLPNLKYLKILLDIPHNREIWDPVKIFKEPFNKWKEIYEKDYIPLEKIYIQYPYSGKREVWKNWGKVIKICFKLFPKLKEFHITTFNKIRQELNFGTYLICSKMIVNNKSLSSTQPLKGGHLKRWKFEVMNMEDGDWRDSWTFEKMINYLQPPPTIRLFDPVIVIQPGESRPYQLPQNSDQSTNSYDSSRYNGLLMKYENLLIEQITAAAEEMIELVPSLEEGAFWERGIENSYDDWYRWTWKKVIINGVITVETSKKPFILSKDRFKVTSLSRDTLR
ncbi:uncharacterized protein I206_106028 [Kwoniella pini CBS 10737]|uniref:Uncharacterized protein n=1 Tax=Kwoniella pini CBS 10737 TaxID=1296096 RepID=A0A1B9I0U4_9TREE|nr:uncharacterized protein I206_04851 [Kwoniella pini CBS 10737]OCF49163.1 hypothetical protein I206_04851 [Kwoniella pini CBS 10737]